MPTLGSLNSAMAASMLREGDDLDNDAELAPVAVTATTTATPTMLYGNVLNNTGAAGAVVLTLPVGQVGQNFKFVATVAQTFTFTATTPDKCFLNGTLGAAAGSVACTAAIGSSIRAICVGDVWHFDRPVGTWTVS